MFPATQNTGTLTGLIQKIGSHGVPSKFTTKELPAWGYKSSHDRSVVGVLRFIGFLDGSGVPTDLWREARTKPGEAVAKGVRAGYHELFAMFPDAERKDVESLTNFFKAKTDVSEAGVKQIVSTFKALAQIATFAAQSANTEPPTSNSTQPTTTHAPHAPTPSLSFAGVGASGGFSVNMNIELTLPADTTGEVYEKFFAAMKKHLLNDGK